MRKRLVPPESRSIPTRGLMMSTPLSGSRSGIGKSMACSHCLFLFFSGVRVSFGFF